jgi:hypothetical protein
VKSTSSTFIMFATTSTTVTTLKVALFISVFASSVAAICTGSSAGIGNVIALDNNINQCAYIVFTSWLWRSHLLFTPEPNNRGHLRQQLQHCRQFDDQSKSLHSGNVWLLPCSYYFRSIYELCHRRTVSFVICLFHFDVSLIPSIIRYNCTRDATSESCGSNSISVCVSLLCLFAVPCRSWIFHSVSLPK